MDEAQKLAKLDTLKAAGKNGLENISLKSSYKIKSFSNTDNPIKDGLSDTSLDILKMCLKLLKERHEVAISVSK